MFHMGPLLGAKVIFIFSSYFTLFLFKDFLSVELWHGEKMMEMLPAVGDGQ